MKTVLTTAAAVLLLASCAAQSNTNYYNDAGYDNLAQKLDDMHTTAQKIKDAQNEYKTYNSDKDNYLENKVKQDWENKKSEYKSKTDTLKNKSEQIKKDWKDISDNW